VRRNPNMEKLRNGYLFPEVRVHNDLGSHSQLFERFLHSLSNGAFNCFILWVVQISMRREAHQKKYPDAKVISLGIGDTTEPIPSIITSAMAEVPILCLLGSNASCLICLFFFPFVVEHACAHEVMGF
jgi:hypothetical protein